MIVTADLPEGIDTVTGGPVGDIPGPVDRLVQLIRSHLTDDLLRAEWLERRLQGGKPTTGHCVAAASAFWWLAGGRDAGWRQRNLPERVWPAGPHYFVVHAGTGLIVDPTADQFDEAIPYGRADGRGPPTSGGPIPKAARTLAARVMADPEGPDAIEGAKAWAYENQPDAEAAQVAGIPVVSATIRYREQAEFVVFDELPDALHRAVLKFADRHDIRPTDIHDDAVAFQYRDAVAVLQFIELAGHKVQRETKTLAQAPALVMAGRRRESLTPAADQGSRTIDAVVRKFLRKIKAQDIHCRRFGQVQYTWRHDQGIQYGDTSSDVRWLIRVMGPQLYLECHDIKPFSLVLQKPFTVNALEVAYRQLLEDMDADAGVP